MWLHACLFGLTWGARGPAITAKTADLFPGAQLGAILGVITIGSGLGAAVIMGVVRQIMRGIAQLHAEPALMLDAADRALRLENPDKFVTAFVGVFDPINSVLTYASA